MENTETQVTIKKPGRVLHFSDGVEEEIETEEASELACEPEESEVDPVRKIYACLCVHLTKALMDFVSKNINDCSY